MKNLPSTLVASLVAWLLAGTVANAVQVKGEFVFEAAEDGSYFDQSLQTGDLLLLQFAYQSGAEPMPILDQFPPREDVFDYMRLFAGTYDLIYLRLDLNRTIVDFPDPKLSIQDSEWFDPTEGFGGMIFHNDVIYLSSPFEDFLAQGGGFGAPDDNIVFPESGLPTDRSDFGDELSMTLWSPQAISVREVRFNLVAVPEPATPIQGFAVAVAFSLSILRSLRSHAIPEF